MGRGEILRVESVTKEFDSLLAVSGVSFAVKQGEIFGLLGPNGAGKTTLIRMILGILSPDLGRIVFAIDGSDGALRKERVGYLPEERGLYEDRRVGETILYLSQLHGVAADRAQEQALYWLNRLSLGERLQSRLKELSKGMQQKVQFIAAVAHQPDLVVLDEPFSSLDPVNQDLFRDVIRELAEHGMTVLLSSHQMNLVESLCDRVFLIHRGRRVLYGELDEIKRDHGEDVVWLRYAPTDPEAMKSWLLENGGVRIISLDRTQAELVLTKGSSPNELLRSLVDRVQMEELTITKPPLHRIFVDVVQGSS
jgi:ABC-2 type transport system ATP-binding protein